MSLTSFFEHAILAAGGNSRAARSARAKLQPRDRYGRWIETGRGVFGKMRFPDGTIKSVIGKAVGGVPNPANKTNPFVQMYVSNDPNGLPDGFYTLTPGNAQGNLVATLDPSTIDDANVAAPKGSSVGERADKDIPNSNDPAIFSNLPYGLTDNGDGSFSYDNYTLTQDPNTGEFSVAKGGETFFEGADDWADALAALDRDEDGEPQPPQKVEPGTADVADPNASTPEATTPATGVDTDTFDVAKEGFLVPTGKRTEDISPESLADFVGQNKEALGKGGARIVIDTDAQSAEIHNSADSLDNARAQAGGIGTPEVIDLSTGESVNVEEAEEAQNGEGSGTDAVEPERTESGATAPVESGDSGQDQPAAEQPAAPEQPGADSDLEARVAELDAKLSALTEKFSNTVNDRARDRIEGQIEDIQRQLDEIQNAVEAPQEAQEAPEAPESAPEGESAPEAAPEAPTQREAPATPAPKPNRKADALRERIARNEQTAEEIAAEQDDEEGDSQDEEAVAAREQIARLEEENAALLARVQEAEGQTTLDIPEESVLDQEGFAVGDPIEWVGAGNRNRTGTVVGEGKGQIRVRPDKPQRGEPREFLVRPARVVKGESSDSNTEPAGQDTLPEGVSGTDGDNGRADSGVEPTRDDLGRKIDRPARWDALEAQGLATPDLYELPSSPENAKRFHEGISKLKENNPYAASVYVYSEDEYEGMRLFMTEDGTAGVAIKDGDEMVSGFVHGDSPHKGAFRAVLSGAIAEGGVRGDAFDTILPHLYAQEGFVPVARQKFNDEFKPEGWDFEAFNKYNGGRPDVVFLRYDESRVDSKYVPGEGQEVSDYDDGIALSRGEQIGEALDMDVEPEIDTPVAPEERDLAAELDALRAQLAGSDEEDYQPYDFRAKNANGVPDYIQGLMDSPPESNDVGAESARHMVEEYDRQIAEATDENHRRYLERERRHAFDMIGFHEMLANEKRQIQRGEEPDSSNLFKAPGDQIAPLDEQPWPEGNFRDPLPYRDLDGWRWSDPTAYIADDNGEEKFASDLTWLPRSEESFRNDNSTTVARENINDDVRANTVVPEGEESPEASMYDLGRAQGSDGEQWDETNFDWEYWNGYARGALEGGWRASAAGAKERADYLAAGGDPQGLYSPFVNPDWKAIKEFPGTPRTSRLDISDETKEPLNSAAVYEILKSERRPDAPSNETFPRTHGTADSVDGPEGTSPEDVAGAPTGDSSGFDPNTYDYGYEDSDEDYANEKFMPTGEQRNIVKAVLGGKNVAVQALAGTGKTTTLELMARRIGEVDPKAKILYIAFNKSVQEEAQARMPSNVEARTGDSLGFTIDRSITKKFNKQDAVRNPQDVASYLGIPKKVDLGDGISADGRDVAMDLDKVITAFAISEDSRINASHFEAAELPMTADTKAWADSWWADLNDPNGELRIRNDHITKIWALGNPDLSKAGSGPKSPATIIFFDEAQDINPVMAKVVRDQSIQKVYVGDGRQAIYGFRGAENELDNVEVDVTLPLTQSWRFGPEVAGVGNRYLSLIDSPYKIVGGGPNGEIVDAGTMQDPDAILTRSNAGAVKSILAQLELGRTVGADAKFKSDLQALIQTVQYLKDRSRNKPRMHEDLAGYKSWDEVEDDVDGKKATAKVEMLKRLVDNQGIDALQHAVDNLKVVEKGDKPGSGEAPGTIDYTLGATGVFEKGVNQWGRPANVNYEITKGQRGPLRLTLTGNTFPIKDDLKAVGFRFDGAKKGWYYEGTADRIDEVAADFRSTADAPIDVVVTTAHKAKGLEWGRVKIADDFRGPTTTVDPDTGEEFVEWPEPEELRLAYVAVTRAQNVLDPGSLSWVYSYTNDSDEDPNTPSNGLPGGERDEPTPMEQATPEPEPTPEVASEPEATNSALNPATIDEDGDLVVETTPPDLDLGDGWRAVGITGDPETRQMYGDVAGGPAENTVSNLIAEGRDSGYVVYGPGGSIESFVSFLDNRNNPEEYEAEETEMEHAGDLIVNGLYSVEPGNGAGLKAMQAAAIYARDNDLEMSVIGAVKKARPFYARTGGRTSPRVAVVTYSDEDRDLLAEGTPNDRREDREWEEATTPAPEPIAEPTPEPEPDVVPESAPSPVEEEPEDDGLPGTVEELEDLAGRLERQLAGARPARQRVLQREIDAIYDRIDELEADTVPDLDEIDDTTPAVIPGVPDEERPEWTVDLTDEDVIVIPRSEKKPMSQRVIERGIAKNIAAGKEIEGTPDFEDDDVIRVTLDRPNAANTVTKPREAEDINTELDKADKDLLDAEDDPTQLVDPNLIWDDVKRTNPGYITRPTGDLLLQSKQVGERRYDLVVRRTPREKFYAVVVETDKDGNQRVMRLRTGRGKNNSYRGLLTQINRGKTVMAKNAPKADFDKQRSNIEHLAPHETFGDGMFGGYINGTDLPETNDASYNAVVAAIATLVRDTDIADNVLETLAKDRGFDAGMVKVVREAVVRRRFEEAVEAPNTDVPTHISYDNQPLEVGQWVDWTDVNRTIPLTDEFGNTVYETAPNGDFVLTRAGKKIPVQIPNPNYGRVYRGQVKGLDYKAGEKYVYSDSARVIFPEINSEKGWKASKQSPRIASKLRVVSGQNAPKSAAFYPETHDEFATQAQPPLLRPADLIGPGKNAPVAPVADEPEITTARATADEFDVPETGDITQPRNEIVEYTNFEPFVNSFNGMWPVHEENPELRLPESDLDLAFTMHEATQITGTRHDLRPGDFLPKAPNGDVEYIVSMSDGPGETAITTVTMVDGVYYDRLRAVKGENALTFFRPAPGEMEVATKNDIEEAKLLSLQMLNGREMTDQMRLTLDRAIENAANLTELETIRQDIDAFRPRKQGKVRPGTVDSILDGLAAGRDADQTLAEKSDLGDIEDVQKALAQDKSALDGHETDKYQGHDFEVLDHKGFEAIAQDSLLNPDTAEFAQTNLQWNQLKTGDVVRVRTGVPGIQDSVYAQVISSEKDPATSYVSRLQLRRLDDPSNPEDVYLSGYTPNQVSVLPGQTFTKVEMGGGTAKAFRPTSNIHDGYFVEPGMKPAAPREPRQGSDFRNLKADDPKMLVQQDEERMKRIESYNTGFKFEASRADAGNLNIGAAVGQGRDGRKLFTKQVSGIKEYGSEVLAMRVYNVLGGRDNYVSYLDGHPSEEFDGSLIYRIVSDRVDADSGADLDWGTEEENDLADLMGEREDVLRFALLDLLLANADRHSGNYMIKKDGTIVPIDHEQAFMHTTDLVAYTPFSDRLLEMFREGNAPMTSAQLLRIKNNLGALRSEFDEFNMGSEFNSMMLRLNKLIDGANGHVI